MARRIGLAQALINDPDLLILDEPTTGLDPLGTREIKDLITFLNREKRKTILLCSHLLADVEDVCRRVIVMYGGRRQAMGDIQDLLSQKNLTQITTDRLDDRTIERIREIVEAQADKHLMEVSVPSDRLETFFLRIVREAQQAQQRTSGAQSSGQIAEFLASSEGAADSGLVDALVAASRSVPAADSPSEGGSAPEPAPAPALDVIENLVPGAPDRTTTRPSDADPPTSSSEGPVDDGVIDDLLHRPGGGKE
jgi:ABC-2 type transport system ATP-binding protein